MKLVVDIDKNDYDIIKYVIQAIGSDYMPCVIIANGTPLEKVLEDIKAEIKQWYWDSDKQALAKDPCVVDAMTDLFIRTIDSHISGKEKE